MARRMVRAVRADDGHLQLLEAVELPDREITVTLDLPEDETTAATRVPRLPVRDLGPMKAMPTRDELYGDTRV